MPTRLSDNVLTLIRELLVNNWDPTATAGYDPTLAPSDSNFLLVHTGSYSYNPSDPQVALPTFEEGTLGGGATGYSGMAADGTGANQDRDGTVFINCWAEGEADYNGEHPQDLVDLLVGEVARILLANQTGYKELRRLAPGVEIPNDDTDADPVVYGQQIEAAYGWVRTP